MTPRVSLIPRKRTPWTFTPARAAQLAKSRAANAARLRAAKERWGAGPSRKMGKYTVYRSPDDRPFILNRGVDGVVRRKFGEIDSCETCGKFMFRLHTGNGRWTNCSTKCGGYRLRRSKKALSLARGGPKKSVLDSWFSRIIRSAGACVRCGTSSNLQCAHIVGRRYLGVRYDLANAVCLCAKCHMFFTYRPIEWEEYIISRIGGDALRALKVKAREFSGPLNRVETARFLYAEADRLGFSKESASQVGYSGWKGLQDPDALRSEHRTPAIIEGLQQP